MHETILSILTAAAFIIKLSAADTNGVALLKIGSLEATNYYDKEMIVAGKVAQVTIRPTVTFLNLDKKISEFAFHGGHHPRSQPVFW